MPSQTYEVVKIRMIAPASAQLDGLVEGIQMVFEGAGYEVIEVSQPAPCRYPDEDKDRTYITAAKKVEAA